MIQALNIPSCHCERAERVKQSLKSEQFQVEETALAVYSDCTQ